MRERMKMQRGRSEKERRQRQRKGVRKEQVGKYRGREAGKREWA